MIKRAERSQEYDEAHRIAVEENCLKETIAELCKIDLFYLLTRVMQRRDVDNDWLFDRCLEVQMTPNEQLDLWAREHYKSTIITFALSIQEILKNPEITIGIFSHTKPIARAFLRQIKYELESNETLKELFPDILWQAPKKDAYNAGCQWSEDKGITVRRKTNPKECTVEAHGLVDGQPTSKHYSLLIYDDVVTRESVSSPEMMLKTTDALALSYNLGAHGGNRRFIGTRYHYNDTYATLIQRGTVKPRIHPATDDGTMTGKAVFLTDEKLADKRADMGPYIYACFTAETKVLARDFTETCIEDIAVGDVVVGYKFGGGKRARLAPSKVLACSVRKMSVVLITFESGRSVTCTPDHRFWSGRSKRGYAPLSVGKKHGHLDSACSVYDPQDIADVDLYPKYWRGYLAAMIDGEGSVSGGAIHVHQCFRTHPKVCDYIELALNRCGFDYGATMSGTKFDYYIKGGRAAHIRLLNMCTFAKQDDLSDMMFANGTRNFGKGAKDKVVSIEAAGEQLVYNLQTETGNYVANGYAAKNCQMLQDPKADSVQGFEEEWVRTYINEPDQRSSNYYILVDPANEKRKLNDYTSMMVIAAAQDGNYYWVDGIRDRLNLTERTEALFKLHAKWKPLNVGYEKYGMQSDTQHIKYVQQIKAYHFKITELGGQTPKNDRIRKLVPIFEQSRMWLPQTMMRMTIEGKLIDLVNIFIDDELKAFPVMSHDDMLDCMARIEDEDMKVFFPVSHTYSKPRVLREFTS